MPDELAESFGGAPGEPDEPDLAAVEWLLPMATSWGRGGGPDQRTTKRDEQGIR